MIKLIHGDCLEEMKSIPNGNVDAIIILKDAYT